ncbi:NUDIX hydrolase [Bhargavaea cecembensis]|uniref:NUDIX hydrolase n=1 Tax=Bhargavaea cecembensis TaxID=394098 RepID=UPI00058EEB27|nr:8-oxo-dGTP diphosphatase [Bhargavaea cecembensis]
MQRIANLLVVKDGRVLLMKKPRRGWYVAPGGKMEPGESVYTAACREFTEETGALPKDVHLKGVYTMVIRDENDTKTIDEWMLFTFIARDLDGVPVKENREGTLDWHDLPELASLPMAEGDRTNLEFAALEEGMQYGTFTYTEDFRLIREEIQRSEERVEP